MYLNRSSYSQQPLMCTVQLHVLCTVSLLHHPKHKELTVPDWQQSVSVSSWRWWSVTWLPCSLIVIASRASALIWVSLQLHVFCQSLTWASFHHPRHSQPVFLLESQLHSVGRDSEAHTCSHYKTSLELWHADFSLKKSHGNPCVHTWEHHWIV